MPYPAARAPLLSLPLVLLLTLPLLLAAAPAESGGGWAAAPSGDGRPSFYCEGAPGAVLQDTVAVTNRGAGPLTVRLRAAGAGLRVVFAGPAALAVPARTRAEVPFTVTVPADARPGDVAGGIVVRDAAGREAAVPLLVRVGGPRLAALTVERVAVHGDRITYELVNRGTTVLVPQLAVHADGVLGAVLDRAPRTLPVRLPPGRRLVLDEPWPDRPALDAVTVRLTVTAPGAAPATGHASARFVPWAATAGTASGALSGGAVVVAVRRRGRRPAAAQAESRGAPA
ncbi:COG1470 family protein [Streptomyces sp. SAS_272]|uniref:COG1470 family protein n=1 Tax=Streptomyces sp. SAS_272 TaxID=3412747 RepID=UPI00403CA5FC